MGTTIVTDLYVRYSDLRAENMTEDGEAKNINNAVKLLRERATHYGWRVGEVIIENDVTGDGKLKPASAYKRRTITLPNGDKIRRVIRPGFARLVERLKAGVSQAVVALDLDRLVRDPRDLEDFIDVCQATGAHARSLSGSLTFTSGGTDAEILIARVMVAVASKSSADNVRRQKVARERKALAGEFGGGRRPYGREADGVTIHEPEAQIIREACRRVRGGISLRSQCRSLNAQGLTTVAGRPFSPPDFRDMLLRPWNAGVRVHGKDPATGLPLIIGEDPAAAIVARDVWDAVTDKLADPGRRTTPGPANKHLGTGLFRCWCGSVVTSRARGPKRSPAYACRQATGGKVEGTHIVRSMTDVDQWVIHNLLARLSRPDAADLIAVRPGAKIDVAALRAEVKQLRDRKVRLAKAFGGDGDIEALIEGKKAIDEKLTAKKELLVSATEVSPLQDLIGADDVRTAWNAMTIGEKRAVLGLACTVEIWGLEHGDRRFDASAVRIHWNE